ncbi:hypothetical protein DERF_003224 [Dermatophagoides farinae]|uniref:DOMON domain-containing protein n=1 Tax=Dermatophagoides farinae TaxID=6954 RepID=A0A922IGI2_DERFA|nr:hypothetical protein DERF_003224 [Dermatophagoides farinae]
MAAIMVDYDCNDDGEIYPLPRLKCSTFQRHISNHKYWCGIIFLILIATNIEAANYDNVDIILSENIPCLGSWRYPSNCSGFNCDYKATWQYFDESDEIVFTISTKNRNKWTGIGFSDNTYMSNSDAVLGLVEESGRFFLMDSFLKAYEAPPLDYQQNLYNMSAWRENGLTTLRFSRPRQTGDARDYQFSDTDCPYFMFPVMGGVFNAVNKRIRKHESTPIISDERICVHSCQIMSPTISTTIMTTTSTTTFPPSTSNQQNKNNNNNNKESSILPGSDLDTAADKIKIYQAEIKFLNLMDNNKPPTSEVLKMVEHNLHLELKPYFDRVKKIEINELKMDPNNNVAIIDLSISQDDKNEKEDIRALTSALNSIMKDGQIGRWNIDSNHLVVTPKEDKANGWMNLFLASFNRFNEEEQRWIIIGAGLSALLLLALIQLLCMFCSCGCGCGCRKKKSEQEDYLDEKASFKTD